MAQITSGRFKYLRVVKDDDFGIKREFEADLSFSLGENESPEEIMGFVAQKVVDIAHEKLRIKTATAPVEAQARAGLPLPTSPLPGAVAVPNDKEKLAAALVEKTTPKKGKKAPAELAPAAAEDLSDIFGEEAAVPDRAYTDKELVEAVNKKNATLKAPPKIVALKEKFVGPLPKQLRDIPSAQRAQFLTELEALS